MAAGAGLAMLSFAIAAYRFSGARGKKPAESELSAAARFCVNNSGKIAATISLGRRGFQALAAFMTYFVFDAVYDMCGVEISTGLKIFTAFTSLGISLLAQYALLDLPAARMGMTRPTVALARLALPFYIVYAVIAPFEYAARKTGRKIFGSKIQKAAESFDYIDVEVMLRAEESDADEISPYTGKIVRNAIKLQELDVSDIMLPRSRVIYLDLDSTNAENLAVAQNTRHTRYPVCRGDLDSCLGIINIKDLLSCRDNIDTVDLSKMLREPLRVRERDKLETALAKMLKYKLHLVLVEDDFGGVIGVLTLDSALSELVGEIRDEFDAVKDQSIQVLEKNKYKIFGSAPLRKVEDFLDVDFRTDEVSTFGGLITFSLGRFPEKGERLYFKEQRMRVVIDKVDERSVSECTASIEEPEDSVIL